MKLLKVDQSAKDKVLEIEKDILSRLTSSNLITIPEIIEYYFNRGETFLIEENAEIVGVVGVEERENKTELTSILIKKKHQSKGIGTKVLENIFEIFDNKRKWEVITHPENHPSIRLYWKFGFEFSEWLGDYFKTGEPRIKMVKREKI